MNSDPLQGFAPQIPQIFSQQWAQMLALLHPPGKPADAPAADTASPAALRFDMQKLMALQQRYQCELTRLLSHAGAAPEPLEDKRFAADSWRSHPGAALMAQVYLLNSRTLLGLADALEADEKTRRRVRFAVEQWSAAFAPSNMLAFNPEAQRKLLDSQGASLAKGISNLLRDMQQGHVSMTDESLFEVGRNMATTEGAVVFENDFFQLIEYKPLTEQVFERPLLLVPPCINKYYILDLQPENSLIRHAVAQGQRSFVISWRNPDTGLQQATWDDYIEQAVITAIGEVREIAGSGQINTLGFCVGGTMLASALAVLAARGEAPVASATLLTTLLDFSDTGILDIFIDEPSVKFREWQMGQGGLLKGQELASTFSFLRPNELVWNYVVGNYLQGETPPPFDLLYWNSDATNLPGPFYAWYLRNMYLENKLVKPGALTVCGQALDLSQIDMPVYIYGSREDHIVPADAAYASTQYLSGPLRFVLGASGHIAGVINPPAKKRRSHWIREDGALPASLAEWVAGATEHAGSWWHDWSQWLAAQGGAQVAAPQGYGREPIEPAPGRYVRQKADANR
ncbi:PHA/PHB synthase family protein [Comamonas endophytica]|uniref:Class I poly(R)-hydroxyalkanoic acid synthase n=1 Tax=Comamonas endophytica TaxID=2949090 RepID=A0ABY6G9C8_9BURK|nr:MULTISPECIES: class I poly(R)-hydroxyalkanoic acid synthase [unclassified Acidovorax]MCD2511926.1 class I poly(R)-hydroxyalkanoic acid synthase [Acidovorax sp. D4N7]UYG51643.1 class I poly(R)-hydroxyalkanoic acid synthase [Acidovorax sp. 5MLIR]